MYILGLNEANGFAMTIDNRTKTNTRITRGEQIFCGLLLSTKYHKTTKEKPYRPSNLMPLYFRLPFVKKEVAFSVFLVSFASIALDAAPPQVRWMNRFFN